MRKWGLAVKSASRLAGTAIVGLTASALLAGTAAAHSVTPGTVDLGTAGTFVLAGPQKGAEIEISGNGGHKDKGPSPTVNGNIFAPREEITDGAKLNGGLYRVPDGKLNLKGGIVNGSIVTLNKDEAWQIKSDLESAVHAIGRLEATQAALGDITGNTNIMGTTGGLNVIDIRSINLADDKKLTFTGGPNDIFVVRVAKGVKTSDTSMISSGNVGPNKLLLAVGGEVKQSDHSMTDGTYIALTKDISMSGGLHNGAFLINGHDEIEISGGSTVNFVGFVPEPGALTLLALGMGGIGLFGRRRI